MATKDITDADITDTVADIEKMSEFHGSLTHHGRKSRSPLQGQYQFLGSPKSRNILVNA